MLEKDPKAPRQHPYLTRHSSFPRGGAGRTGAAPGGTSASHYAIPTRDPSSRQLTTGHCPAVPTRAHLRVTVVASLAPVARPHQPPT